MESNPFAPPATSDLDGGAASSAATGAVVSEEAMRELVEGGLWARRLARVTIASIAIGFVGAIVSIVHARRLTDAVTSGVGLLLGTMLFVLFVAVLRRYAAASERLARGQRSAAEHVIAAQAAYFKLSGAVVIVGFVLWVLAMIVLAIVRMGSRGGS